MKSWWFPFRDLSLKARLFLSTSLVVATASLLALAFSLFIDGAPSAQGVAVPLLVFLLAAAGAAVLLHHQSLSPLRKFMREVEANHQDLFCGGKGDVGLSSLPEYVRQMEEKLKSQKDEAGTLRKRLLALSAVTAAMNQDLEADQLLNDVLGTVLEVTGFDGGVVFLRSGENDSWDIRAWRGLPLESMWGTDRTKMGQGILEETFRCRRVIFASDVDLNHQQHTREFRDKGIKTILAIPFVAKRRVCGAALLVDFQTRETSLEEEELLEAIGRQLGMAITDTRLLSESTAKARDLSLLLEVCSDFSAGLDPERIMKTLSEKMLKALDADFCHTALVDSEGIHLAFEAFTSTQNAVSPISPGEKIGLNQLPLYQKVITTNKMIRIKGKGQLASSERQLIVSREAGEVILIPLATEKRTLGVIGVGLRRPEESNSEKLDMGRSIAQHAASALERAQLYQNVKEKADELSSLYQMAQKLSSILDWDELQEQILKVVVESFGYLNSAVLLVDPKKHELYVKAAHGFPDDTIKNCRIKIGEEGVTGWVAQTGRPLVVGDVKQDPRYIMGIRECRSEIAVPVKLKGAIIGVLDVESDKLSAFGEKDLRLLSQLASQIAVVLENSRLFSGERRRCVQLALINDVGRKVLSTLDLDRLLTNVIETIQLSFKYDHISLFLWDESEKDFTLKTCCGSRCESVRRGCRLKKGVGMVGRAAESGKSLLCNKVAADPGYIPAIADTQSELSVPIKKGHQVLGVLDIQCFAQDGFDEQDAAVMETVTDLLATAVTNARLYEETKGKAHRLELADQINRAISSSLDVSEIFGIVSKELKKIWDYDRIVLSFWYPEERLFRLKMSFCPDAGLSAVGAKNIPAEETNMTTVIQTEKPFYQARLSLSEASKSMDRLIYSEGIRSYVYVPVMDSRGVIAVLGLESRRKQAFGPDRIELLESVSGHLSVAIQNAGLFSDLQKAYHNLKKAQTEMIQIERFRALGEMAGGVVHDFNNILASILGRVQLILMKLGSGKHVSSKEIKRSLEIIESSAEEGAKILSRIREFTKAKPEAEFSITDVNRVIEDSLELTQAHWRDKVTLSGISVEVDRQLKAQSGILGDESELREVITGLILNAMDAMPQGGTLTLRTEEDQDSVLLTVKDTGVGMTEEVKNKIFSPFFTTKGEQGTGLGLSLAKGIVTRHKGDIRVKSSPGAGTSFMIRIPRCKVLPDKTELENRTASVLVVEDEQNIREVLEEILSTAGHQVAQAASGEEGIELLKKHKPDLVITDLGLPGVSGWEVAEAVKKDDPSTPVVIFTGWGVKLDEDDPKRQNVDRFITKPFNMEQILTLVSELTAQRKTKSVDA